MPVRLGSKLLSEGPEARIEIVPLIDIMFFLLAAFMLVSLSMVKMKNVKVNLPTATTSTPDNQKDFVNISVDKSGAAFLDKKPIGRNELIAALAALHKDKPSVQVLLSGDERASHGDVVRILDAVRSVGIDKVALQTNAIAQRP